MTNDHSRLDAKTSSLIAATAIVSAAAVGLLMRQSGEHAGPAVGPAAQSGPASTAIQGSSGRGSQQARNFRNGPISPIPEFGDHDIARAELGRRLFHDADLSADGEVSCASCHDLESGGDDGRQRSIGVGGSVGSINSPTVFNARFNFRQFWNGRARDLVEQVDGPLTHPAEMATSWVEVLSKLNSDEDYRNAFESAYGHGPDADSVRDAIATFEMSLTTPGGAFDRWLMGDDDAISEKAKSGYELFEGLGCITCHQGVNVGGNMFQPLGKGVSYFETRGGEITEADLGRFSVTGKEFDRHVFRVAPLRNVELTAPYLHDGSAATLEEAVQVMALQQLGEELTEVEVGCIVAFLKTLTGDVRSATIGRR